VIVKENGKNDYLRKDHKTNEKEVKKESGRKIDGN